MTDKTIMIDDVDVSECPHIEYGHMWWDVAGYEHNSENVCALSFDKNADFEEDFLCQDNPNCYYKQLKSKEQECIKIFRVQAKKHEENTLLKQQIDQLKAENDRLKTYITSFDYLDALSNEQVAVLYTTCIDELAIRGYKAKHNTEASLLTRYHNALTEIKEMCKQKLPAGLSAQSCYESFEAFTGYILQKCEVMKD